MQHAAVLRIIIEIRRIIVRRLYTARNVVRTAPGSFSASCSKLWLGANSVVYAVIWATNQPGDSQLGDKAITVDLEPRL